MQEVISDLYDVILTWPGGEDRSPYPLPGEAAKKWAMDRQRELDATLPDDLSRVHVEYRPSSQMRLI